MGEGLKIVVKLSGGTTLRIDDDPPISVQAPAVVMILSSGEHRRYQEFEDGVSDRYAIVHVDPEVVRAEIGVDLSDWVGDRGEGAALVFTAPLDAATRSAATQIASSVARRPTHRLYRLGKALELVALALEQFAPEMQQRRLATRLRTSELERVQAARDFLFGALRDPPGVEDLARRVGLTVRKLNSGFRRTYGGTVQVVLQQQRLEMAYKMLASGELSVAEVAYEVGYTPAHLSTAFRKRFGVRPSGLR
ncbi:helix-turn-helix domain-containing protein [Chelatococcus reniformis]|uniref:Regulatory protein PchR n=1 Tax=Chelatococcus reniformis TaxID=1494448 RepID=A0A916UGT6_9HYPH|nr:AraC family transcriptional regulator [Chelatococcus reniformis]GGC71851.1 regulatory protein PchR [Chelatococcus reniformis]